MNKKKNLTITIMVVLSILLISLGIVSKTVIASNKSDENSKVIASIQIEKGDTLWGIAVKYYTDDYDNVKEYINEIKQCNGLASDTIHAGQYLIIPHFIPTSTS